MGKQPSESTDQYSVLINIPKPQDQWQQHRETVVPLETRLRDTEDLLREYKQKCDAMKDSINTLQLQLQFERNLSKDGHFIWHIDQFQSKLEDLCVNGMQLSSEAFYTSRYGYKFRLELHPYIDYKDVTLEKFF